MSNIKNNSLFLYLELVLCGMLVFLMIYGLKDAKGSQEEDSLETFLDNTAKTASGDLEEKIIYLTFDDGPTPYTVQMLELLEEYDVQATFFVTNQYPECQDMIGRAYEEGHTIGLHSYTHDYSVYSSEAAYYEDLELLNEIILKQTGELAKIVRFPGGSSNSVSWNYCSGIMTCLAEGMEEHGYIYCDWNVDSMDSHGYLAAWEIAQSTIARIQEKDVSIVLMHDIGQCNVDAAEMVISWGLENGYIFLPMDEHMEMVHHSIVN